MKLIKTIKVLMLFPTLALLNHCNNYGLVDHINALDTGKANLMFISKTTFTAATSITFVEGVDCSTQPTGLAKLNCLCKAEANSFLNDNVPYYAWASFSTVNAKCNIQGLQNNTCSQGFNSLPLFSRGLIFNNELFKVANSIDDLLKGKLIDSPGGANSGITKIYTGSTASGVNTSFNCTGWTAAGSATIGDARSKFSQWTNSSTNASCGVNILPIYCFSDVTATR